jgi:ComF family protein
VSPSTGLCAACFGQAHFIIDPCCDHCAAPFETEGYAGLVRCCEGCHREPPAWDRARAAFLYDAFSRRLILPLKYADRTENARTLGLHMARVGAPLLEDADLIVPVPLHRARLRSRRYNQAALLARACLRGRSHPLLVLDALQRQRSTAPLATRSAVERRRELKGAIVVSPSRARELAGRHVVLVDDVLTTGATATECAVALRASGAASISLLVAARTAPPRIARAPLSCT